MSQSVFEIPALINIAVAPSSWRIIENPDKTYSVFFRYYETEDYCPVLAQNGEHKIYKTTKALLGDIAKVHSGKILSEALIRFIPA